jgi:hypothetical protein
MRACRHSYLARCGVITRGNSWVGRQRQRLNSLGRVYAGTRGTIGAAIPDVHQCRAVYTHNVLR